MELGDALISSVEGKANAIEATLQSTATLPQSPPVSSTDNGHRNDSDIFE